VALACSGPPAGNSEPSPARPTSDLQSAPTNANGETPAKLDETPTRGDEDPVIVDDPTPAAGPRPANETPTGTGFWLAAGRDGQLHVAELGDELVLAGGTVLAHVRSDGALERMPDVLRGLVDPGDMELAEWEVVTLGGRWPDPVWMYTQAMASRSTPVPYMYYRKGDRWQRKLNRTGPLLWSHDSFAPWTEGRVLALRKLAAADGDELSPARQKQVAAALAADPPRIDVLAPGVAPEPAPLQLTAGSRPISLAARTSGEVFVLSLIPGEGDQPVPVVERFAPGSSTGTLEQLRKVGARETALTSGRLLARGDAVYLVGEAVDQRGLVLRRDGQRWQPTPPLPGPLRSLAIGPEATLWAILEQQDAADPEYGDAFGTLYKRTGEGAWKNVPLPQIRRPDRDRPRWVRASVDWQELPADPERADEYETMDPDQVVTRADGEVWITGGIKGWISADGTKIRHVALRSRPVREVLELPDAPSLRAEMLALQPAKPWDQKCLEDNRWLQLGTLAASDPPEAAMKLADDLLAAVPPAQQNGFTAIREVEVRGRRMVGLLASPVDDAQAAAILAAAAKLGPDKPRFECFNPRPIRALKTF